MFRWEQDIGRKDDFQANNVPIVTKYETYFFAMLRTYTARCRWCETFSLPIFNA